jgi:hypothetical protein
MTNNKITHSNPISGDRHPQSENHVKMTKIVCITVFSCLLIVSGVFLAQHENKEVFEWFKNIQIFLAGGSSAFGIIGVKKIWTEFKNE